MLGSSAASSSSSGSGSNSSSGNNGNGSASNSSPPPKRISTTVALLTACILGVVVGLFGLNYWHASKCGVGARTPEEIEAYVAGIGRRILQSESLTIKNGLLLEKMLILLQSKLAKAEESELAKLSVSDAAKVVVALSGQPAPPMPEFDLDAQYEDAEKLADAIDEVLGGSGDSGEVEKDDFFSERGKNTDDKYTYKGESSSESSSSSSAAAVSEALGGAEAARLCNDWKVKYSVVIGVSWGQLPFDLQKRWKKIDCDLHFRNEGDKMISSSSSGSKS